MLKVDNDLEVLKEEWLKENSVTILPTGMCTTFFSNERTRHHCQQTIRKEKQDARNMRRKDST